jgi:hypothetical protein
MTQIDADGEKAKQKCAGVVEALVPRACNRQAVGTTASTTAPGTRLDGRCLAQVAICECPTNPRRFEAQLSPEQVKK